jgi:hypothetical protein
MRSGLAVEPAPTIGMSGSQLEFKAVTPVPPVGWLCGHDYRGQHGREARQNHRPGAAALGHLEYDAFEGLTASS